MDNPTIDEFRSAVKGRAAVVTGASTGIGRAIAIDLAKAGADVVVHAKSRRAEADAVATAVRQLGQESLVILADISDADERLRLIDTAWQWRDGVQIWVNNAGADVLTAGASVEPFLTRLDLLWRTDVVGTIDLARETGRRMSEMPGVLRPSIINMGWDQAEIGMEGESGEMFAAVKGAISCFTRSLARSLAPRVRVNCLAPGWIRTKWGDGASDAWQQRAVRECLLERWGTPEDVASVALFLASPAAAFLTGQVIAVNGGLRAGTSARVRPEIRKDAGDD